MKEIKLSGKIANGKAAQAYNKFAIENYRELARLNIVVSNKVENNTELIVTL